MNGNLMTSAVVVFALLLSGSGCSSIGMRMGTPPEGHYPHMGGAAPFDSVHPSLCVGRIDSRDDDPCVLPFSLLLDAVLFSVDLIHVIEQGK